MFKWRYKRIKKITNENNVIEKTFKEKFYPLHIAVSSNNIEIVKYLLNYKKVVDNINTAVNEYTPLFLACFNGNLEIVKCLIDKKASLDKYNDSFSPLIAACNQNHYEILEYLKKI